MTWPTKKLGEVAKIVGGGTPSTKNDSYWGRGNFWATPRDLAQLKIADINSTARVITELGLEHSSAELLPVGSVILSTRAPIGYVAITTEPMAINQGCRAFICGAEINNRYLYYFFVISKNYLQSLGRGATFTEINKSTLENIKIPLPPLATQKQIVERLDKIAEARKLNDDLIQKSDELFQSLLHQELNPAGKDWEVKKLEDNTFITSGGTPRRNKAEYFGGNIPWVKSGELRDGFVFDTEEKITRAGLDKSSAKIFPIDTVLIAMYGATVGKVGMLKIEAATNQAIAGIQPKRETLDPYFIFYFLLLTAPTLVKKSKGGAQPNINQGMVKKLKIPLPPLKIQKQIVEKLSSVQNYKKQLLEQKIKLKELFDSVLYKSFQHS